MLRTYDHLPSGFLDADPRQLERLLGGPSLIHLSGRREQPLLVSILLHGNELSGLYAVQELLRDYHARTLPRAMSIFVGNVAAAAQNVRRLDEQPDYNRIWPGGESPESAEARMLAEVVDVMRRRRVFASMDIHNNTGMNPLYGCVNRLEPAYLYLASLFSRTVVYFTQPRGVQSLALAELCPAVTVECGQSSSRHGARAARQFIEAGLHLESFPDHPADADIHVYHTIATLRVPPEVVLSFGDAATADLQLLEDLEQLNFHELPIGTTLARVPPGRAGRLLVEDERGRDVSEQFLREDGGEIRTLRHVMPAMLTRDERVVRQDCLGYLMQRLSPPEAESGHLPAE